MASYHRDRPQGRSHIFAPGRAHCRHCGSSRFDRGDAQHLRVRRKRRRGVRPMDGQDNRSWMTLWDDDMLLGCIADDLTGATDLALMLTRGGMRTVQVMGVPDGKGRLEDFDAVVVALKSRTNPAVEAVAWSLASADALLARGARQLLFKYCSTFDSTDQGNIGPVAEALLDKVKGEMAIACPAFPANKRTVYLGNLFVGDVPLAESPMKDHPLTPMRDSNLVRVLQRQMRSKVGLIPFAAVAGGVAAIRDAYTAAARGGHRFAVVDA